MYVTMTVEPCRLTVIEVGDSVLKVDYGGRVIDTPLLLRGVVTDLDEDDSVLVQVVIDGLQEGDALLALGHVAVVWKEQARILAASPKMHGYRVS